jgi:hypothetical protein
MGWGTHPDTLSCSAARFHALDLGHAPGTLRFLQAYRDHYAANSTPQERGRAAYLAVLDGHIDAHYWAHGGYCPSVPPLVKERWMSVNAPSTAPYSMTTRRPPNRWGWHLRHRLRRMGLRWRAHWRRNPG